MKKIIDAKQTKDADHHTIVNEPIASVDLMERASIEFVSHFVKSVDISNKVLVVCGTGNNGGDGFAITRLLAERGYTIQAVLIRFSRALSPDCQLNFDRLDDSFKSEIKNPEELNLEDSDIIIDAIFSSGLNRSVTGFVGEIISKVNDSGKPIISVDIPSGLMTNAIVLQGSIIQAIKTISFQRPKLTFMLPETGGYVNDWEVADIGLDETFIASQETDYDYQTAKDAQRLCPVRSKFNHKGDFGRVQVFSGSLGKVGAAFLCAKAVSRAGVGLLTVHVPRIGNDILQTSLPEAMLTLDKSKAYISEGSIDAHSNAICIGPGLGQNDETKAWLEQIFNQVHCLLVLDADALNFVSKMQRGYKHVPKGAVITPHVGEFHRLFGAHNSSLERIKTMKRVSSELGL